MHCGWKPGWKIVQQCKKARDDRGVTQNAGATCLKFYKANFSKSKLTRSNKKRQSYGCAALFCLTAHEARRIPPPETSCFQSRIHVHHDTAPDLTFQNRSP